MKPPAKQVLADRSVRPDELVVTGHQADMVFRPGQRALSLRAGKLWHLLVKSASIDLTADRLHTIALADLYDSGIGHMTQAERIETLRELQTTLVEVRVPSPKVKGRMRVISGPLLSHVERDEDDRGDLVFEFSRTLRRVFADSPHWGVLSKRAVMAFESRYALRLFEIVAVRINHDHKTSETFALDELRARLGVPVGKLERWDNLRARALDPAIAEVNQLAGFTVRYEPIKQGRAVSAVRLHWAKKPDPALKATKRELDGSKVGRKSRRDGSAETVAIPDRVTFPASGGIDFTAWVEVKRAAGCNMDNGLIADKFRRWCAEREPPVRLDAANITELFSHFCRKVGQV